MAYYLSLLVLALAVSIDSFGVGLTYGLRKIVIPLKSILIIALFSGMTVVLSMLVGQGIGLFLTAEQAEILGGCLLVGIGIWALYQVYRTPQTESCAGDEKIPLERSAGTIEQQNLLTFEIKTFGIVIQILRKPMMADLDRSGVITMGEASVLGLALSLDAFGAGIGAALFGYPVILTAVSIALMSSLFLILGTRFGHYFAQKSWKKSFSYVPGLILILFGIMKMF